MCSWGRITKPKDDSAPIPVFGSKLMEKNTEQGTYKTYYRALLDLASCAEM